MTDWKEIISSTVNRWVDSKGTPIPGATLKPLLVSNAGEDIPGERFIDFLKDHSDIISIIQRPGTDILIVPIQKYELLVENDPSLKLRQDVYKAFTWILDYGTFCYDPAKDMFILLEEESSCSDGNIIVPTRSLEDELGLRKDFISLVDAQYEDELNEVLEGSGKVVFHNFSKTLAKHKLFPIWQKHRGQDTLKRIHKWSLDVGVEFKGTWTTSSKFQSMIEKSASSYRKDIFSSLAHLSQEDLARISIPLDIVQKLFKK